MRKELYGVDMKCWSFRAHTLTKSTYARVVWYVQEDIEYMVVVNLWGNHNRVKSNCKEEAWDRGAYLAIHTDTLREKEVSLLYHTHRPKYISSPHST